MSRLGRVLLISVLCMSALTTSARSTRSRSARVRARHSLEFFNTHNVLRIESYLSFQTNNGLMNVGYPNVLFRYGLIKVLELRLGLELSSTYDATTYTTKTGINPIQPGLRVRLLKPHKFVPAMALTAGVTIPMAASPVFRQTYWAPFAQISAEQDITSKLSFEYDLGMQWDADNFQRSYFTSVNMEYDFTPASTVYADLYYLQPESDQSDVRVDVGVNRTITQNLQFDLSMGAGLTAAAPEFFFNIGFIFAYNNWKKVLQHKNSFAHRPPPRHISSPMK